MDCLFFDKPYSPLDCFIVRRSAAGSETIIDSLSDLQLDEIALTNLDLLTVLELNEQVQGSCDDSLPSRVVSKLLPKGFFTVQPEDLLAYLGHGKGQTQGLNQLTKPQRAFVAKHYNTVLDALTRYYGFAYDSDLPFEKRFCASQLILKNRFTNRSFDLPTKYSSQLESLYEENSVCSSTRVRAHGKTYRFTAQRNMVDHLAVVANRMIPFGVKLEEIDAIELGSTQAEILKRLEAEDRPFCAQITILEHEPDLGVLACLYTRDSDVFWVNDVDLIWLAQVCSLRIEKILLSRAYVAVPHDLKPNAKLFGDPLIRFSPAANTVAQIHLDALVGSTTEAGDSRSGLLSTWLKSIDKAEMLIYARMAKALGFEVVSFGLGKIDLLVHESLIERFKEFLVKNAFQSPSIFALERNLPTYLLNHNEPVVLGAEMMI